MDTDPDRVIRFPRAELDLSPEDVAHLLAKTTDPDEGIRRQALEQFTLMHVGLVVRIAQQYARSYVPLNELVQEGLMALVEDAIPRFKPELGNKFSTYAALWLRKAMRQLCDTQHSRFAVKVPRGLQGDARFAYCVKRNFIQRMGRSPTDEELLFDIRQSKAADERKQRFTLAHLRKIEELGRWELPLSLQQRIGSEDTSEIGDILPDLTTHEDDGGFGPGCAADAETWRSRMQGALLALPYQQREIIRRRYGGANLRSETLGEIGVTFEVSRERIRQIESKALRRMARQLRMSIDDLRRALKAVSELEEPGQVLTSKPSVQDFSRVLELLDEHAVQARDGWYVIEPEKTLAVRLELLDQAAHDTIEYGVRKRVFERVPGVNAIRLMKKSPSPAV